jgi:hypothetical protein
MRIADPQQRQPGCSENILRLECRHGRLSQSFHIPGCARPVIEQTEVRACSRVIMIFWLSRPLDLTLVLHIVDLLGYPDNAAAHLYGTAGRRLPRSCSVPRVPAILRETSPRNARHPASHREGSGGRRGGETRRPPRRTHHSGRPPPCVRHLRRRRASRRGSARETPAPPRRSPHR